MGIPFHRFALPAAVLAGLCLVAQLSAQAVPPTTSTYFTDPQPTITVNGSQIILHKELSGYPNYGVTDGGADILYTGQAATWHFSLPPSVQPSQVQAAFFRASLVAEDGDPTYSVQMAVWVNGSFLSNGPVPLPYGSPYGSRFNNWVSKDYPITSVSQSLTLTLQNTSTTFGWIAADWIELQLTMTGGAPPLSGEFVYVANQGTDNISGYRVDPSSGALTAIPGSPFAVAGSPWSIAIHPSGKFAYATGGFNDNINGYAIDPNTGALSPLPGSPFAASGSGGNLVIAMHPSGKFAYVTDGYGTYVSVYTINSQTGALTLSGYSNVLPVTRRTMVVHPSGKFVYMTQECVLNGNACNGSVVASVQGYAVDPATGTLIPIPGSPFPTPVGSYPALAADPTGDFLYLGNGYGPAMAYRVDLSTGVLASSAGAVYEPTYAIAVAPQGHLIFDSSINGLSAYRVDPASGLFTSVPGSPWQSALSLALSADCTGKFLYVANWYSSSVSGYAINAQTGALSAVPGSPFPAGNSPGAIAAACGTTSVDTTPPVIVPQITGTLGNNGWYRSAVSVSWSVTDPESGIKNSSGCTTTNLTTDTAGTTLTCSATNGAGLSASVSATIKIDQIPPMIAGMPAPGCSLWPPNGKMVQVATVTAADALSGLDPSTFQVTGTSNEPPSGPEISITPNGAGGYVIALQADRWGTGTGRIYTLTATASDLAGNTAAVTATCTVPHDQGK